MRTTFQRGLVVGKFCPLHFGHESVIRHALARCREVIVLSYTNPEFPGCEPATRRSWLAARFPEVRSLVVEHGNGTDLPPNDAAERTHRRFVGRVCRDLLHTTVDAVFTSESYGDEFAAELTAFFRESDRNHGGVTHVLVDAARDLWPVSGTMLRKDLHVHRRFLAPEVYASFVQRVALLGGESSGKTTLAAALATEFQTEWVPEYGRELWEARRGNLQARDYCDIVRSQIAREEEACLRANRLVFCDSTPLTTCFYREDQFGEGDPELTLAASRPYHQTILCSPDFPFVQDGTRRDAAFARRQHHWYVDQLTQRDIKWIPACGSLATRVRAVRGHLHAGAQTLE